MQSFVYAAGTVVGRDHRSKNTNGHDAFSILGNERAFAAVVCDGCGSGAHSEVGAKLGARLMSAALIANAASADLSRDPERLLERIRQDVLAQIRVLANAMGGNLGRTVSDYFLFTIVAMLSTEEQTLIFGSGDGVAYLNGSVVYRGEFANNTPPYLAYGLVPSSLEDVDPALLKFQLHAAVPTPQVQSALLATDGVLPLIDEPTLYLPGRSEVFGELSQFWDEERYFTNADALRRRLFLANRDAPGSPGLLLDDTTIIAVRRRE
jgi:hypothetical protein